MISVMITVDDEGNYLVGTHGGEMPKTATGGMGGTMMDMMPDKSNPSTQMGGEADMRPAKNIDDALQQARELLERSSNQGMMQVRDEVAGQVWPGR
jgi:hypothetical protein